MNAAAFGVFAEYETKTKTYNAVTTTTTTTTTTTAFQYEGKRKHKTAMSAYDFEALNTSTVFSSVFFSQLFIISGRSNRLAPTRRRRHTYRLRSRVRPSLLRPDARTYRHCSKNTQSIFISALITKTIEIFFQAARSALFK